MKKMRKTCRQKAIELLSGQPLGFSQIELAVIAGVSHQRAHQVMNDLEAKGIAERCAFETNVYQPAGWKGEVHRIPPQALPGKKRADTDRLIVQGNPRSRPHRRLYEKLLEQVDTDIARATSKLSRTSGVLMEVLSNLRRGMIPTYATARAVAGGFSKLLGKQLLPESIWLVHEDHLCFRQVLKKLNLPVRQACRFFQEKAGLHESTVYALVAGTRPKYRTALKVCRALGEHYRLDVNPLDLWPGVLPETRFEMVLSELDMGIIEACRMVAKISGLSRHSVYSLVRGRIPRFEEAVAVTRSLSELAGKKYEPRELWEEYKDQYGRRSS